MTGVTVKKARLRFIILLPGTVLLVGPALILWFTRSTAYSWDLASIARPWFWLALILIGVGLHLMVRTVGLFATVGKGTPAPWSPPRKLVVAGVYRHVRNPMIGGAIAVLFGEAWLFQSLPLLFWALFFLAINLVYIPFVEEPRLEKRFGEDYRDYRKNVPRWIPRLKRWEGLD